jgi:segregation and condensation protein B
MNEFYTRNVLEAALLAAGKPLTVAELGQLFDENTRPKVEDIRATLDALAAEYSNRGLEVKETAAGFRIQVRREFASEISRLWPERPARYSRALLETLALIAYRQPITRAEIEAVRGVAVNPNIVKTVIERNWVRVVGHRDVPGRPELLGTTREFLDYFGLRSLDELPPLAELKAMGDYNLQLELPNAGALGVDGEGTGTGVVDAAVALLTSDGAGEGGLGAGAPGAELVVGEAALAGEAGGGGESAAAGDADARGADGVDVDLDGASGDAVGDVVADGGFVEAAFVDVSVVEVELAAIDEGAVEGAAGSAGDETAHGGDAAHHGEPDSKSVTGEASHDAVAEASGAHDEAAAARDAAGAHNDGAHHAAADGNGAEGAAVHDAVANAGGVHDEDSHRAVADANGVGGDDVARDAGPNANGDAAHAHDAVADAVGSHDDATHHAVSNADADDLEADRTLSSGDASKHAAESDDSDAPEPAITNASPDALEDAADDDADEDELSADGHGSRELVAAPRDIDD